MEVKDFCIKIIHKAAYFFDPRERGRLLNDEVHPKFLKSARSIQLKKDFSKWCFYGRMFLLFPQLPAVEWYCGRNELNKTACKILTIPATSAAVERLFSCNSNVHTVKRNRLSNERAAKAVFVSQTINLDSESYACCERPVLDTASPDSYASCSFHIADKVIEIDSCDCRSDSYI